MQKIVFTGGPGIGKTTTTEYLKKEGLFIVEEPARDIIEEAKRASKEIWSAYTEFDFNMIIVPAFENQQKERAEFVMKYLRK